MDSLTSASQLGVLGACSLFFIKEFFSFLKSWKDKKESAGPNADRRESDRVWKEQMSKDHEALINSLSESNKALATTMGLTKDIHRMSSEDQKTLTAINTKLGNTG